MRISYSRDSNESSVKDKQLSGLKREAGPVTFIIKFIFIFVIVSGYLEH